MTMVGGFDVHGRRSRSITWTASASCTPVRFPGRPHEDAAGFAGKHLASGDAEFALEGCTGWRYVVEELAMVGLVLAHLGDRRDFVGCGGPECVRRPDCADARRLLRTLLVEGRLPESSIPSAHVVEVRDLGRLYCALMAQHRAWQQRIHAQLFHQGCPPVTALLSVAGRDALAGAECRGWDASMWTRRYGA